MLLPLVITPSLMLLVRPQCQAARVLYSRLWLLSTVATLYRGYTYSQAGGAAYDLDSLHAREAWFRLKLLWSGGSCLSFHDMDQGRPYNISEWPECGPELARMRTEL